MHHLVISLLGESEIAAQYYIEQLQTVDKLASTMEIRQRESFVDLDLENCSLEGKDLMDLFITLFSLAETKVFLQDAHARAGEPNEGELSMIVSEEKGCSLLLFFIRLASGFGKLLRAEGPFILLPYGDILYMLDISNSAPFVDIYVNGFKAITTETFTTTCLAALKEIILT